MPLDPQLQKSILDFLDEKLPIKVFDALVSKVNYHETFFESLDGWDNNHTGTGAGAVGTGNLVLSTGTTSGSDAIIFKPLNNNFLNFRRPQKFKVGFRVSATTNQTGYMVVGNVYYGLKISNATLQGVTNPGGGETTVNLLTLSANTTYEAEIIYNPGFPLLFKVSGSDRATLAHSLVSVSYSDFLFDLEISNTAAENKTLTIYYAMLCQYESRA